MRARVRARLRLGLRKFRDWLAGVHPRACPSNFRVGATRRVAHLLCASVSLWFALASCSKETGKYQTGPNDPALKVTEKDLAQVRQVLDKQEAEDRAKGLRKEQAPPMANPHEGMGSPHGEMPAGHPPIPAAGGSEPALTIPGNVVGGGSKVDIGPMIAIVPEGWTNHPPSTPMRKAEFTFPASAGDPEGGELSVTTFGAGQGGTVEANLERWINQFGQPDGRASKDVAVIERLNADGMNVTFLDVAGTFLPPKMPGMPQASSSPRNDWRMLAAIVETPDGMFFFKATGPKKTMGDNREKMLKCLGGLKRK